MTQATRSLDRMRRRNSFRWKVSIGLGLLAAIVVLTISSITGALMSRNVKSSIDESLRAYATHFIDDHRDDLSVSMGAAGLRSGGLVTNLDNKGLGLICTQLLQANGDAVSGQTSPDRLPISIAAMEVARGDRSEWFEQVELDGRAIRILTVAVGETRGEGALQVGLDVTTSYANLARSRLIALVAALIGGLATTIIASLLGSHLVAPITAMAQAVDRISKHDELPDRLEGEGLDELGRLVASFNQMLEDLRRSRAQQRRLVADAGHELRTPLTRLRLKIEFVHSQPQLPQPDRQRLIEGAVSDLAQLGDLVSELLELAAEGTAAEQSQPLQLANVVSAEVERFRATSGRSVDLSTTPGLVQTRPRQVSRALTNLLVNADKYSPRGHPISVTQRGCNIEVRDQGPGIPPNERERVFDRFYRGSSHQSVDGSGLGLAIVESVARVNGGKAWVRDPHDGGPGTVVGFSIGPTQVDNTMPRPSSKAMTTPSR